MSWMPRSGLDSAENIVWLPRLFDKARRAQSHADGRLFDGYCYGDNDFIDRAVLQFLRTNDGEVSALLRNNSDDAAAGILVSRSGRTPAECIEFSTNLRLKLFDFAVIEADEGRLPAGFKTSFLRLFYNRIMMPFVYPIFRRAEQRRDPLRHDGGRG